MTTYLTAADIMRPNVEPDVSLPERNVTPETPVPDLLGKLLDTPGLELGVVEGSHLLGTIDGTVLLEGLGHLIVPRDDSSYICLDCSPYDYSASSIARAVEDADAHLVDLWTVPSDHNTIQVTLRVRHSDPSACVNQLERHGFNVTRAVGANNVDADLVRERILGLQAILNV